MEGTGVNRENPRVSLVAAVFSDVRSQVGNLAKAIAGIVEKHIPRDMDLGLAAFGKGSLVLGFTLAAPTEVDEKGEVRS